ncbi:1-acyl-sn-glycerol-3-phosphate acyltransferase [Dysgonomonas sp. PFB1-18]|uniref:1-acyl-sn-glycerol-3-phosphate acyltransferase n=1 Tax=unclassified Dysgonomonas TaxID=2630389 RepID=UPI002472FC48|nr:MULTISPECIES: 1-acyl-sn-glycerol-3-phosphate acyltransferase [unclassified Dysgonomonas]MDH6307682.1 1-acyl-sn-glycerol-3-phosphate acyltransferase [Dysgonomonas sp. PF1-14]MDH6337600.1 1-acyl-sn-glycerol-3-phosphate acyltransferase [Dysgonomonas sp. PF1-16]MDH6378824.1 1-acyl-sn-glycerol-3-phosphate acyltransferase [Dysgonomonas sp. PFB1-18]MDH6396459.1 1-acyl-sn-glycerol-3-phosphate acyltransferase [Dysgonomonas sp. PF1-23]
MKSFSKFILNLIGWKITGETNLPDKCVICVAPHTSNWDLPLGLVVYKAMGRKASFLIKKEWFFFPMNLLFKALGGIPVDRSRKTSLTEQMAEIYASKDNFQLAITPEATRKLNTEWKKGFYFIAQAANVPIVVAALDYGKKEADFKNVFYPTGDADGDIEKIKSYYKGVVARHPQYFSL